MASRKSGCERQREMTPILDLSLKIYFVFCSPLRGSIFDGRALAVRNLSGIENVKSSNT